MEASTSQSRFENSSKPRVKLLPAARACKVFKGLLELMDKEWKNIRSLNLGVKSGTAIVDELIMSQLQQLIIELHTLCITQEEAALAVGRLAKTLSKPTLQQLQVLLDTTNHEELADFIRVMVYNTSDPFAERPVDIQTHALRRQGRNRLKEGTAFSPQRKARQSMARIKPIRDDETIRFASYLPEPHPLVETAYELHREREALKLQAKSADIVKVVEEEEDLLAMAKARQQMARAALQNALGWSLDWNMNELNGRELLETPIDSDAYAAWRRNHTNITEDILGPVALMDQTPLYSTGRSSLSLSASSSPMPTLRPRQRTSNFSIRASGGFQRGKSEYFKMRASGSLAGSLNKSPFKKEANATEEIAESSS